MALGVRLGGDSFIQVAENLRSVDAELADYLVAVAYGRVMARPGLKLEERELCVVSALAVQGYLSQLRWHVGAALRAGAPAVAIRETLIQVVPYAGWPSALNALNVMKEAFDQQGVVATPRAPEVASRSRLLERGRLHGSEVYPDYAAVERLLAGYDPELPGYLTENAYGQIYDRPGLSMRQRELIAIAMLTVSQRLPQLESHIEGALRVGATREEAKEVIITMLLYAGWPPVINALEVWKRVRDHEGAGG
jgi:4-carboxymuconolactone decarboxylase